MEKNITIFKNNQFGEIRTVLNEAGEPMFCLADVCKALDIANPRDCKTRLKIDGVGSADIIDALGRKQEATFINESNLYKCIFQSRKPDAEKFQDWVTEEVLPSIRKHGASITPVKAEQNLNNHMENIFSYNGTSITLKKENGNVYVNATEMAKAFNKRTSDWMNTKQAIELISSLSAVTGIPVTGLVVVNQGGINQGTWMHEDVALLFAQWLSPSFYILCNSKIKELLTKGYTTLASISRKDLAKMILESEEEKERLQIQVVVQQKQLAESAPKVIFANAVEGSVTACLIGELAKIITQNGYEIGEKRLFAWLRDNGYLGTKGERYNIPNQKYIEQGLFTVKKGVRSGNGGVLHTTITPKVTGKGQIYFINKFLTELKND